MTSVILKTDWPHRIKMGKIFVLSLESKMNLDAKNYRMLFKLRIYLLLFLLLTAIMISGCQRKIAVPSRSGQTFPKVEITPTEPIIIPNAFSNSAYTGIRHKEEVF